MFNLHDSAGLDNWFQRLNAPLKSLPAEERALLHQEVRQHLAALVAANEELGSTPEEAWDYALAQFGDPGKFGRQMRREAATLGPDPNRWAKDPLTAAWTYCSVVSLLGVGAIWAAMVLSYCLLWIFAPGLPENSLPLRVINDGVGGGMLAAAMLGGGLTGRKMKTHALAGTVYALFSLVLMDTLLLLLADHDVLGALDFLVWAASGSVAAYFASVTKRGWYRPTREDFKLMLPRWGRIAR